MTDDVERTERALEHDIEVLEEKAKSAAERFVMRAAPALIAVAVLLLLAWWAGRRLRNRGL